MTQPQSSSTQRPSLAANQEVCYAFSFVSWLTSVELHVYAPWKVLNVSSVSCLQNRCALTKFCFFVVGHWLRFSRVIFDDFYRCLPLTSACHENHFFDRSTRHGCRFDLSMYRCDLTLPMQSTLSTQTTSRYLGKANRSPSVVSGGHPSLLCDQPENIFHESRREIERPSLIPCLLPGETSYDGALQSFTLLDLQRDGPVSEPLANPKLSRVTFHYYRCDQLSLDCCPSTFKTSFAVNSMHAKLKFATAIAWTVWTCSLEVAFHLSFFDPRCQQL